MVVRRWPLLVIAIVLAVTTTGQTSANTVVGTRAGDDSRSVTPDDLKPNECAAISLSANLSGSGTINGGAAAELITGGTAIDTINGGGGNDCLLAGDGKDNLSGGLGTDVCIGGPGTDSFNNDCETKIQ